MSSAGGGFGEGTEMGEKGGSEFASLKAPGPVAFFAAREIHASFGAETEDVLNRDDGEIGRRGHNVLNERPVNFAVVALQEGLGTVENGSR